MSLSGKLAIVSGGASGIGRAIALRLASDGAAVAIVDVDEVALTKCRLDIAEYGRCAEAVVADLTDRAQIAWAFDRISGDVGEPDILVNNVGGSSRSKARLFHEADLSSLDALLALNLYSAVHATRHVIGGMMNRRWGRVVNISSEAAFTGGHRNWDYGAAKSSLIGFTRSLAREMAEHEVTVNAVGPGLTRTAVFEQLVPESKETALAAAPMGAADPEDIAHAVSFFASLGARHVTGQTLLVNGGSWML